MRVTKKELSQVFSVIKQAVVEERQRTGANINAGTASLAESVEGLLGRLCNYLDLGNMIYNAAKHIAVSAAKKTQIDGRSYTSIAAGVLYFTCVLFERDTTTKDISAVAEVSEATIKLFGSSSIL
jgi:transcription initiation factor TFIIB